MPRDSQTQPPSSQCRHHHNNGQSHHHIEPVRSRVDGGAEEGGDDASVKVRQSFVAALWNPMASEADKNKFNRRRLAQLVVGVLIATCGGASWAFGIFSERIRKSANFSQAELTTITTAGSLFHSLTFPAGIVYDYAGPQYVLAIATVLSCGGFALLALIFQDIVTPTVYSVAIANSLTNMGAGFTDCGSLMTNLFNFPINRGEVVIIQKTFVGLGSTFLSISFDGFFSESENFIGYAIYVCILMFIAGVLGTAIARLPPYKRTSRELNRIAKLDSLGKERERQYEERYFEMFHNPRLVDRRRMNAGVMLLLCSLTFFSTFSVVKTYVTIPTHVVTGLTVIACMCLASFSALLLPVKMPSFFDFEFLPDLRPPEALVDKPSDDDDDDNSTMANGGAKQLDDTHGNNKAADRQRLVKQHSHDDDPEKLGVNEKDRLADPPFHSINVARDSQSETASVVSSTAQGREYISPIEETSSSSGCDVGGGGVPVPSHQEEDDDADVGGRASLFMPSRQSIVGNSAPIAVPLAVAPHVIPSVSTSFWANLLSPLLWSFFITAFAMTGVNAVVAGNVAQIITAANDGVSDQKATSLSVALMGIGSACGRIAVGFAETYFTRRNALLREKQIKWEAEKADGQHTDGTDDGNGGVSADAAPDMTPVYHRLSSSVIICLPLSSVLGCVCAMASVFFPLRTLPVVVCFFGATYGSYIGLVALGVREMFSVDVAKHYNFVTAAGIASSVLLNRVLFGTLFDAETEDHKGPDGRSCAGRGCYANAFYIIAAICALSTFTSSYVVLAWWRIRKTF